MTMVATNTNQGASGEGMLARLSATFWRRPKLLLFLMLTPPLLWLGVIYIGSLFALLAQSFFSLDDFTGQVKYELTLSTYAQLFRQSNLDIIIRTVTMAALAQSSACSSGSHARFSVTAPVAPCQPATRMM